MIIFWLEMQDMMLHCGETGDCPDGSLTQPINNEDWYEAISSYTAPLV